MTPQSNVTMSRYHSYHFFSYGGKTGEIGRFGLEPTNLTEKLTIFRWLSLQDEHILSLPVVSMLLRSADTV
jgi:hypothetical protein